MRNADGHRREFQVRLSFEGLANALHLSRECTIKHVYVDYPRDIVGIVIEHPDAPIVVETGERPTADVGYDPAHGRHWIIDQEWWASQDFLHLDAVQSMLEKFRNGELDLEGQQVEEEPVKEMPAAATRSPHIADLFT
jgi:hypothetical protein